MFSSLNVLQNGKPVTLQETNYRYNAYLEKLLNYGSDASGTHLVSSLWYLDSSLELKDNNGYTIMVTITLVTVKLLNCMDGCIPTC